MLVDDLKKAKMQAMKDHDISARAIYDIVINKYMLASIEKREKGQEVKDEDMISVIMKTIKELQDEKANFLQANRQEKVEELSHQEEVLKQYLPKMLSEEEIKAEIEKLEDKSIPSIMKHFKMNFASKVDMGLVNKIAKSLN